LRHLLDLYHQMPMIAHQAVAPKGDLVPSLPLSQQAQELRIIIVDMKESLAMVAAIKNMETTPFQAFTSQSRHIPSLTTSLLPAK
jgi:hypothetical protein